MLKLITYNLKLSLFPSDLVETLEYSINKYSPDFFCFQEYAFEKEIEKLLQTNGYKLDIFKYNFLKKWNREQHLVTAYKEDYSMIKQEHIMLSSSGIFMEDKGVSVLHFQNDVNNAILINVHLPILTKYKNKIDYLVEIIQKVDQDNDCAIFVCGDFNVYDNAHSYLTRKMSEGGFTDVSPEGTTFSLSTTREGKSKIKKMVDSMGNLLKIKNDWIFVNETGLEGKLIESKILDEASGSDHDPVYLEVKE